MAEAQATDGESAQRPLNVVMIVIDDLNDWVGCLGGHPDAKTPNLDRLATQGRLFTNAHCSASMCGPSRLSVMTGKLPSSIGFYYNSPEGYEEVSLLKDVPTLQTYFHKHGYTTLGGGKVLHQGSTGCMETDEKLNSIGRPPSRGPRVHKGKVPFGSPFEEEEKYNDHFLALSAAEALKRQYDKPFFMSVGFYKPHKPYLAPPRWFELHDKSTIRLPEIKENDVDDLPPNFRGPVSKHESLAPIRTVEGLRDMTHAYLACSSFADNCVGIVLDALANSPHKDNTIVVVWSDNGYHIGEKKHFFKCTLWHESTRNYLAFAGPGVVPGKPTSQPASLVDIYPTLIQLCGLPPNSHLDGQSLIPQLKDPEAKREQPAISAIREGNFSLRTRQFAYIRYKDGAEELYDHIKDPQEWTNLASNPEFDAAKKELAKWLPANPVPQCVPIAEGEEPPPKQRGKK